MAILKFPRAAAACDRKWWRADHLPGDGVLGDRGAEHAGQSGFLPAAVFVSTCLVAGLGSLLMGCINLPMAIGCAISLTAFTAFSLVLGQHISIPVALGAVFDGRAVYRHLGHRHPRLDPA